MRSIFQWTYSLITWLLLAMALPAQAAFSPQVAYFDQGAPLDSTATSLSLQATSCVLPNSFPADTLVHVKSKSASAYEAQQSKADLKPISALQVGDEVLALSEWKTRGQAPNADERLSYEKVSDVFTSHKLQTLVHITLNNGQTIQATEGHPFKTTDGWRDAIMLKKGGKLLRKGSDGEDLDKTVLITNVGTEQKVLPVFNLEVANAHTFFVGADGALVHNRGGAEVACGSQRAAWRQAKRDAGIPTSQTHTNHKPGRPDKAGNKGTDYTYDGGKQVQHHPDGHGYPATNGSNQPHFNNHQPGDAGGGTKNRNHYTY